MISFSGPHFRRPTEDELQTEFIMALKKLQFTSSDLAGWMAKRGDYRDEATIMRSIQRMMSGETRVSGEMVVLVNSLLRQRLRLEAEYPSLNWQRNQNGAYTAQIGGWHVYISPQSKGRWLLSCSSGPSRDDFSPPFGRWLDSLEEAKSKAVVCVEEGKADWAEIKRSNIQ